MKTAKALPILMYHHVSPKPGLVTLSPENFEAQVAWLARNGWHTVGTVELERFLAGHPLPAKSVMLTFDDGYLDNYVYAYPILRRHGLHGVIFLVTGWIGDGPARAHMDSAGTLPETPDHRGCKEAIRNGEADRVMLRWSEIETMQAAGTFEFHSHTHTHQRWDQLLPDPEQRSQAVAEDLAASREALASHLGTVSRHLCWPWGYREPGYRDIAQRIGYAVQYTVEHGVNTVNTDPCDLRRLAIKARGSHWLGSRLFIYRHPLVGRLYLAWRKPRDGR